MARELLGRYLVRRLGGRRLVLRLVETEAYLGAPDRGRSNPVFSPKPIQEESCDIR